MSNWSRELKFLGSVRIKSTTKDHINISCPICGEGKSKYKARGYILREKDNEPAYYYCHNDPDNCSGSFGKHLLRHLGYQPKEYFKLFKEEKFDKFKESSKGVKKKDISPKESKEIEEFIREEKDNDGPVHPINSLISLKTLSSSVKFKYLDNDVLYSIIPISKDKNARTYCYNRGMNDNDINGWYSIPKINHIMIPFYHNDSKEEIYGFQTRSIYDKKYHIELFSETTPKIYNIDAIYQNRPLYIFESIFNLYSFGKPEQSIAILGSKISKDILKFIHKDSIFILDPDRAGIDSMVYYMKLGFRSIRYPSGWDRDINDMLMEGMSKEEIRSWVLSKVLDSTPANSLRMKLKFNQTKR